MSNIKETIWNWIQTAPPPVMLAISLAGFTLLGGWVYALESQLSAHKKEAANRDIVLARIEAKLTQVDTNVQTLLRAVVWENATSKQ